jgi:PKD domain
MKATSTYSVRLDERVIISMLLISMLALLFTAFRYKSYKPCNGFQLKIYANYFDVGSTIFFKTTEAKDAEKWEWDFGDKTPVDKTSGPLVSHVYTQPGKYIISITINGQCKQYENISINNIVKDSAKIIVPQVIWPTGQIMVGQNVVFRDITYGANKWEWYIGEGKDSKRFVTKDVSYTFPTAGRVIVKLFVNGNPDAVEERIILINDIAAPKIAPFVVNRNNRFVPTRPPVDIKDKPDDASVFDSRPEKPNVTPADAKPQAARLTDQLFLQMIRGVVEKSVVLRDFDPYLCGNSNARVSFNGDDIGFSECISRLQKIKKLKSLKANAYTDPGTNCILSISIVYEKRTFLGL